MERKREEGWRKGGRNFSENRRRKKKGRNCRIEWKKRVNKEEREEVDRGS